MRVLDVASGTGNAAIPAAQRGRQVTASDLTPELLDAGRRAPRRRASSSSGSRPTPRTCRSTTSRSTSSCRRSASCSPRTTRRGRRAGPGLPAGRHGRAAQLDARGHDRRAVPHDRAVRAAAAARRPAAAAVGQRGPRRRAVRRPRGVPHARARHARDHRVRQPRDYGEHFKANYGPTIAARANAERNGRAEELDAGARRVLRQVEPRQRRGARFEKEYLVAVGTRH